MEILGLLFLCVLSISEGMPPGPGPGPGPTPPVEQSPTTITEESTTQEVFTTSSSAPTTTGQYFPGSHSPPTLMDHQCFFGVMSNSTYSFGDSYTKTGTLYVDFSQPAACSGKIVGWELCYKAGGEASILDIMVLRYERERRGYLSTDTHSLVLNSNSTLCEYVEAGPDGLQVKQGDFLGFVSSGTVAVAIGNHMSESDGNLKYFDLQETVTSSIAMSGERGGFIEEINFESLSTNQSLLIFTILGKNN